MFLDSFCFGRDKLGFDIIRFQTLICFKVELFQECFVELIFQQKQFGVSKLMTFPN